MFWRLGFAQQSPVEQLLESNDFDLVRLLDEDDLIQECKQLNQKLVDYLATPEQLQQLLQYIVNEPPEGGGDKEKFIYPYKSSEVLACDIGQLNDLLFSRPDMIEQLLSILQREPPLSPLPAGYFCKVMISLLSRRPEETLKVIEEHRVVPLLLQHLGASSVLELLLKVVAEVEESMHTRAYRSTFSDTGGLFGRTESQPAGEELYSETVNQDVDVEWLHDLHVVDCLIDKFSSSNSEEVHANASAALVGLISTQSQSAMMSHNTSSANSSRRLGCELLVPASTQSLLEKTLTSGSSSCLEHGLAVLVELVRLCSAMRGDASLDGEEPPAPPPSNQDPAGTIRVIAERLGDMVTLLARPPKVPPITNTTGTLNPPMGSVRLKVLDTIHALVTLSDPYVDEQIIELRALPVCLDLFFRYEWCNLLHNTVRMMLEGILGGDRVSLKRCLLDDCGLLARIVAAHERDAETGVIRSRGYMGHLRLIANKIEQLAEGDEPWLQDAASGEMWRMFADGPLSMSNDINDRRKLGDSDASRDDQNLSVELGDVNAHPGSFEFRVNLLNEKLFASEDDDGDGDIHDSVIMEDMEAGPLDDDGPNYGSPTRKDVEDAVSPVTSPAKGSPGGGAKSPKSPAKGPKSPVKG
eukprot:CAMPEP_0173445124 /NCGR_PEP_ID=MMETSP1357-20121228/33629_1 /TAXON_ID=77926 /ORGANISM="Hemiselmis rufescens, Strain PCC563" /LENGTH=638 /DNA_ID=CAMNT_0014411257 /DNA_START=44 /DNA_END=1956 /DNA_ORIENTATION=-